MRILLALLFIAHTVCAMDGSPGPLDKLGQAGTSVINFFKVIPQTVKEAFPALQSSSEEESGSDTEEVTPQAARKPRLLEVVRVASPPLQESPPKTRLEQDAVVGKRIPEMPILFKITNKTPVNVRLIAVLTAPFHPKKYFISPHETIQIGTLSDACFEQVYVERSDEYNVHPEPYYFETALFIKLCIEKKLYTKEPQLCIRERSRCASCIKEEYGSKL